jgi:hypothetical protein
MRAWVLLLFACLATTAVAGPGPWRAPPAPDLVRLLAERHAVADDGAMGRNRRAYFHARFQMGVHQIAEYAAQQRDPALAARALDAIEYAFARQRADGGFEVVVPAALDGQRPPTDIDLASGSAFFLSSAATALLALDPPGTRRDWLPPGTARRVQALGPGLARSLAYLRRHQAALLRADARAPNRLLFTALAFEALARLLGDASAHADARIFLRDALALQHADGYFIEGGGFDSSYNGVACAVGFRLLALDPERQDLADALASAIAWQRTRIAPDGEIITAGNQRVRAGGERFLGSEKAVDAGHTVEALMLSAAWRNDAHDLALARAVAAHYGRAR